MIGEDMAQFHSDFDSKDMGFNEVCDYPDVVNTLFLALEPNDLL